MKKIFSLFAAMMLMVSTVSATTIYCKMTHSWWTINENQQPAAVAIHHWGGTTAGTTWPGVRMTPVEGQEGTWSYDVPADVEGLIFVRVNAEGDLADWGAKTADLTLPTDGKNLYTITSETAVWGDPGCTGEWSVYVPAEGGDVDPQPVLADGFYLIGNINGVEFLDWTVENINKNYLLARNTEATENEEYKIEVTLAEGDAFQVVSVANDVIAVWYPGGTDNNYVVDAEHAGQSVVYFRPNADGGEDWFHNKIYVAAAGGTGIDNTAIDAKVEKMIKNGMLLIIKGDKTYNVMGQIVK